ncbi:hypothetical protein BOTBODRAFT_181374 [Botryobasidium botryosum FD-172 SS1]|uniref:Uncharacterized protein n=1 Tax=Botryobasidium botryosum (strain FD-172 SS1) TaxID=930990 RepID=A0A067LU71_BOTB1|nr:hypothetical protein BOTBODRAFT_181374 [Botryobasidium botryosum FD-172 SS1]
MARTAASNQCRRTTSAKTTAAKELAGKDDALEEFVDDTQELADIQGLQEKIMAVTLGFSCLAMPCERLDYSYANSRPLDAATVELLAQSFDVKMTKWKNPLCVAVEPGRLSPAFLQKLRGNTEVERLESPTLRFETEDNLPIDCAGGQNRAEAFCQFISRQEDKGTPIPQNRRWWPIHVLDKTMLDSPDYFTVKMQIASNAVDICHPPTITEAWCQAEQMQQFSERSGVDLSAAQTREFGINQQQALLFSDATLRKAISTLISHKDIRNGFSWENLGTNIFGTFGFFHRRNLVRGGQELAKVSPDNSEFPITRSLFRSVQAAREAWLATVEDKTNTPLAQYQALTSHGKPDSALAPRVIKPVERTELDKTRSNLDELGDLDRGSELGNCSKECTARIILFHDAAAVRKEEKRLRPFAPIIHLLCLRIEPMYLRRGTAFEGKGGVDIAGNLLRVLGRSVSKSNQNLPDQEMQATIDSVVEKIAMVLENPTMLGELFLHLYILSQALDVPFRSAKGQAWTARRDECSKSSHTQLARGSFLAKVLKPTKSTVPPELSQEWELMKAALNASCVKVPTAQEDRQTRGRSKKATNIILEVLCVIQNERRLITGLCMLSSCWRKLFCMVEAELQQPFWDAIHIPPSWTADLPPLPLESSAWLSQLIDGEGDPLTHAILNDLGFNANLISAMDQGNPPSEVAWQRLTGEAKEGFDKRFSASLAGASIASKTQSVKAQARGKRRAKAQARGSDEAPPPRGSDETPPPLDIETSSQEAKGALTDFIKSQWSLCETHVDRFVAAGRLSEEKAKETREKWLEFICSLLPDSWTEHAVEADALDDGLLAIVEAVNTRHAGLMKEQNPTLFAAGGHASESQPSRGNSLLKRSQAPDEAEDSGESRAPRRSKRARSSRILTSPDIGEVDEINNAMHAGVMGESSFGPLTPTNSHSKDDTIDDTATDLQANPAHIPLDWDKQKLSPNQDGVDEDVLYDCPEICL